MKDENYKMKQTIARRISIYASTTPFGMRFQGRIAWVLACAAVDNGIEL